MGSGSRAPNSGRSAPTIADVAERYGAEEEAIYEAPMPDYTVPGLPEGEGGIVSGIVGTLIVLAAAYAVGQAVKGRGEG